MQRDVEFTSKSTIIRAVLVLPDEGSGPYPAAGDWVAEQLSAR